MAEFKIVSRGEGFVEWVKEGYFHPSYLADLLDKAPEPLLGADAFNQLQTFLRDFAPPDRWRVKRKREGLALAALVRASTSDAVVQEVKDLLCQYLSGRSIRRRGRPAKISPLSALDLPLLAKFFKDHIEIALCEGAPLVVPKFGMVHEEEGWRDLAISERAMLIAHKALRDRGFHPPSPRTLRNQLPRRSTLGIFL